MSHVFSMFQAIPLALPICIGIFVLVVIILVIAFFLKMLIEFLPATLLAILVLLFTGSFFWAIIVFLAVAFILSFANRMRRTQVR